MIKYTCYISVALCELSPLIFPFQIFWRTASFPKQSLPYLLALSGTLDQAIWQFCKLHSEPICRVPEGGKAAVGGGFFYSHMKLASTSV